MTNLKRCMSFMSDEKNKRDYNDVILGIKSEAEFLLKLNIIPEESKKIISERWGLSSENKKICPSFRTLNEKLGVTNSRSLYTQALADLANTRYLVFCSDSGEFGYTFKGVTAKEFVKAVNCGKCRYAVLGRNDTTYGGTVEQFYETVEDLLKSSLSDRDATILNLRFGFSDGEPKTLMEIGEQFHVAAERIRQIISKSIKKLRYNYYSVFENVMEK